MHASLRQRLFFLAAMGVLLAPCAVIVDSGMTSFCRAGKVPGDLRKVVTLAEVFGHGAGVALILLATAALDPLGLKRLPYLAACAYGSGLVADVGKLLVVRTRPGISDLTHSAQATFLGWRPLIELPLAPGQSKSLYQSFPSGHTATAVGLAIGLSYVYPRGRWFFAAMACLAAAQRICDGHHFLSDTLVGASVALGWCGLILPWLAAREAKLSEPAVILRPYRAQEAA
jgi:membrane-associated phospholipid phosphatase